MSETSYELAVQLDLGPGHGDEETDRLTRALRQELMELDVESVSAASLGEAPEGAKGVELAAVGALLVKLASKDALKRVAGVIHSWVRRDASRTARLVVGDASIELTGIPLPEMERLIDRWAALIVQNQAGSSHG